VSRSGPQSNPDALFPAEDAAEDSLRPELQGGDRITIVLDSASAWLVLSVERKGSKIHPVESNGEFEWNHETVRWSVAVDSQKHEALLVTFESDLLPHGWVSRAVPLGSVIQLADVFHAWPRMGAV